MSKTYVLVTPARNEGAYIEKTIQSVISQTVKPIKWVIVSDASTDCTDGIVKKYEEQYEFIEFLRRETGANRNFGSKVYSIREGIKKLGNIDYDFIGMLDADVSFQPDYYEKILGNFHNNPEFGIAGGVTFDFHDGKWVRQHVSSLWSVAGAIQMFRRQCYEDIGGYIPIQGGEDCIAEVMARMKGWQVRAFPEIEVLHYRKTGTGMRNPLFVHFYSGIQDYSNGYHPFFEMAKCIARFPSRPFALGSTLRMSGFFWAFLRRAPYSVPNNIITYLRQEQMQRLLSVLFGRKSA